MRQGSAFPFSLLPDRGLALVGQRRFYDLALFLIEAVRAMAVVVLRLLRPFVMSPLLLLMIGGLGAALMFALRHDWRDAGEAGLMRSSAPSC
ncbi:hypothetical protein HN018_27445 (plasmid) [Lichenicola cladoniae]|uniref:Uncharacterized protein n=1 Tax=Lichenicola cladoniae TaxID=1484109 RepID=A0A6M8HZA4_9PROT|nr:hypothetical protein [Lichenicola cladoniae]QKE93869.1 hypothetical protein HN018_27445 [Lichenicola cladoniae]